jgi:hypothetical protein
MRIIDVSAACPRVTALVGADELRRLLTDEGLWRHPLQIICSWENEAREQYLTALERAVEVMEEVLRRSPATARGQLAGNLRNRKSFESAVAEVMTGARLELLGFLPVMEMESGSGRRPDFRCEANGSIFYIEVYTPRAAPLETLIHDIHWHLRTLQADCFVMLTTTGVKRDSRVAKQIAQHIGRGVSELQRSGMSEAIFIVPHGGTVEDWDTRIGATEFSYPIDQEPAVFARATMDGGGGFRLGGGTDLGVVNDLADARNDLQELGQLQKDGANVLVVDLTARQPRGFMTDAYQQAAREACERHPELAAVLLTWRLFGFQPAPSIQQELRSGYILVPSGRSNAAKLPSEVVNALTRPQLIHPRRPD